jgi:hypothetical protein
MGKGYNLGFESHPTSKDMGFHGANKDSWGCESGPAIFLMRKKVSIQ